MNEEELLRQIALRPFDLEPRLVYADLLAEQGDPRAEVIALAARGELTMAEKRRLKGIVHDHARRWLGPLEPIADSAGSVFVNGFLDTLVLAFNARPADLLALRDEPRLATVRTLDASTHRKPQPLGQFLRQPSLASLVRLVLAPEAVPALAGAPLPFSLEGLGVCDNGLLEDALEPLAELPFAQTVPRWELVSRLLFASVHAQATFEVLRGQLQYARRIPELRLVVPYGVFEGVGTWLMVPTEHRAELATRWPGERWSIEAPGLLLTLHRGADGRWPRLEVGLSGEGMRDVDDRISRLASVLVLLGPAALDEVAIALPPQLTVTRAHRYAIKSAARRLRGCTVTMGGETLAP
ncbi:MAG: TIGR02996 domain-containing protein [Myxococcaceae bacterium]|nr:TIGR02996 domain-containing protein [Myxococcaceae bacterium]